MSILKSQVNLMSSDKTIEEVCTELIQDNEKKAEIIEKLVKEIALLKAKLSTREDDRK